MTNRFVLWHVIIGLVLGCSALAHGQTLTSIEVTPAGPVLSVGETQPFTAIGTMSDGSMQTLMRAIAIGASSTQLATFEGHGCAVMQDGTVRCWGYNFYGQLGNGTIVDSSTPVQVSGISNARAVDAGLHHTVALLADGAISTWGRNDFGQLGNGSTGGYSATPGAVVGLPLDSGTGLPLRAIAIAVGDKHTVALLENGTVWSWGWNAKGQLGNDSTVDSPLPVQVVNISTATTLTARFRNACVILSDETIRCWGENEGGQLGDGNDTLYSAIPVQVQGISTAIAIDSGDHHTLAVLDGGEMRAWGRNFEGQLGHGDNTDHPLPVAVLGISTATATTGGDIHSGALLADHTIKCWGRNPAGALGNGVPLPGMNSNVPVDVVNISTATAVVAGGLCTHALLADGSVWSWGENELGQLGNGAPPTDSSFPVLVSGIFGLVWSSSNTAVAAIDPTTGIATALSPGMTTITATSGGISASVSLMVSNQVAVTDSPPAARPFEFASPWPNPAEHTMNFEFELPALAVVRAEVVDVGGRRVLSLLEDGVLAAGSHRLRWDGRDSSGRPVAPGVYLVRISAGAAAAVRRIVVIE